MAEQLQNILNDPVQLDAHIKSIFDEVDSDKSGFVDEIELESILKKFAQTNGGDAPSKEEVAKTLKTLDLNQDGKISLDEFKVLAVKMLTATVAAQK